MTSEAKWNKHASKTFNQNAEEYTFIATYHRTFSKIDHRLAHKANLTNTGKLKLQPTFFLTIVYYAGYQQPNEKEFVES